MYAIRSYYAKRGSHIVITTIMFNYIAAALIVYLLVEVLRPVGQMDPATARFPHGAKLPNFGEIPGLSLIFSNKVPVNVTFFIAVLACWAVWIVITSYSIHYTKLYETVTLRRARAKIAGTLVTKKPR